MKIYSAANLAEGASDWSGSLSSDESPESDRFREETPKHLANSLSPDQANARALEWEMESYEDSPEVEVDFCSRSEAICAEMLRRYVPHFELRPGITFQVAIGKDSQGNTLAVDFLVDGVLFEYHPVRFFKNRRRIGDFNSKREYRSYTDIYHSLRGEQRDFFQATMRARLSHNYYTKRRGMLDQHPMYRRMELVVATSPEEFYNLILKRFGKNVPRSIERFLAIFDELRHSL